MWGADNISIYMFRSESINKLNFTPDALFTVRKFCNMADEQTQFDELLSNFLSTDNDIRSKSEVFLVYLFSI